MFRFFHQLPFLCGLPFLERRASETAHLIVGRTGKHLFLTDNDDGRRPLLLRMVDDCDDLQFRLLHGIIDVSFLFEMVDIMGLYGNEVLLFFLPVVSSLSTVYSLMQICVALLQTACSIC
jgi:hypothetical protein